MKGDIYARLHNLEQRMKRLERGRADCGKPLVQAGNDGFCTKLEGHGGPCVAAASTRVREDGDEGDWCYCPMTSREQAVAFLNDYLDGEVEEPNLGYLNNAIRSCLAYIEELEGRSHGLREDLSWALDCLELCLKRIEAVDGSRPNLADVGLAKARAQLALASDEGLARYSTFVPIGNDLMPLLGVEWTDPIQIKLVDGELIAREPAPKEETTDDE